jgi:hypothetical protein
MKRRPLSRATPAGHGGTRFRLFPAYADGFAEPETVVLSPPAGTIAAGPDDPRMYTVTPLRKDDPYDPPSYAPPYQGPTHSPATPDRFGHFDWIPVECEQFLAAHTYGTVRRTLDIWEHYLGRPVVWWHAAFMPEVELVPVVHWSNAHSGPGFIEMGRQVTHDGSIAPFCLNYDVLAHETGHAILFSQIGAPPAGGVTRDFLAFHESFADLIAIIGILHFRSITAHLLAETHGNLYVLNVLNRIGTISRTEQIRIASNLALMSDVADLQLAPDGTWIDPMGQDRNQHAIAEPLTGAIFDILVEFYQDDLVDKGVISPDADARGWTRGEVEGAMSEVSKVSSRAFSRFAADFHGALHRARDLVGICIAHAILTLRPDTLTFAIVAARFLEAAAALGEANILPALLNHFLWRGIDPRPHLAIGIPPGRGGRPRGERGPLLVTEPPNRTRGCHCGDLRGFLGAHRLMTHPHRKAEYS